MLWWLIFLGVIAATSCVDVVFALYTRRTAQGKALSAAIFSVIICLFSAVVLISYLEDRRYIAAAVIGSFLGTYFTVKWDHE